MSRKYRLANEEIFARLDRFCADRGLSLSNSGTPRWIATESKHKSFMAHGEIKENLDFSAFRCLLRIEHYQSNIICAVGFDTQAVPQGCVSLPTEASYLTVVLFEKKLRPSVSISAVRDVVEFSDLTQDTAYKGHDPDFISRLYPSVKVFKVTNFTPTQIWASFFLYCLNESDIVGGWIDERLHNTLNAMAQLDPELIPYKTLCRSVLDGDPQGLFLALYRCLEALYAYSSSYAVKTQMGLSLGWAKIAEILEGALGWHPHEQASLENLFNYANRIDLVALIKELGGGQFLADDMYLAAKAAKRVYGLRNLIVHFRPAQQQVNLGDLAWNRICENLSCVVLDIYYHVHAL